MRTLVVSHDIMDEQTTKLRGLLRTLVDSQGPGAATFGGAEQAVAQSELTFVVVSPDAEQGLEVVSRLRRATANPIVAVGQGSDPKLILRALQQGADHFVDQAELESSLGAALARLRLKQQTAQPSGRLVCVLATSGGSGASTVAVNLAGVLAGQHEKCALLDLNAGRGDLAALLDLKPAFTLAELCLNITRLDRAVFDKMLIRHASGIHLLAAPQTFRDTKVVTAAGVNQALNHARGCFPFVVVDMEDCFHEEQVVALRQSSTTLLISRLDFTALRNARRILGQLGELDIPRSRIRIVINRSGQPNQLPVSEAEDALGEKLTHCIPDDPKTINGANNAGIPAVLKSPTAKVSQSFTQLAKLIVERRRADGAPAAEICAAVS